MLMSSTKKRVGRPARKPPSPVERAKRGRFAFSPRATDDTDATAAVSALLSLSGPGTSTGNSITHSAQVANRHFSQRFTTERLTLGELLEMRSKQVEEKLMPSKKRAASPAPTRGLTSNADSPTTGMRQGGRSLIGSPVTSRSSIQSASTFPSVPMRMVNEVAELFDDRQTEWEICDIHGSSRQVVLQEKIVNELGFPPMRYPTGIELSTKIFTPCNHPYEPEFGWCKGNHQCHHCQCGCNRNRGDCATSQQRGYMYSHNLVDAIKCTCTGTIASKLNLIKVMDGEESMVTDTLDRARREFLYPVIARMADDSLQAAVLELRIKHAMMYPNHDPEQPLPIAFSGDARWNTPWGHKALDCTVYIQIWLIAPDGTLVKLVRRTALALTYHRNGPGKFKRTFVNSNEKAVHSHAGACDPIGLGAAVYILSTEYGFDVVRVLHDRDGSGMKEVRRVKAYVRKQFPFLNLQACVCGGEHFIERAPKNNTERADTQCVGGLYRVHCVEGGGEGGCYGACEWNCIRHWKVNMRKAIGKSRARLMGLNKKAHDAHQKRVLDIEKKNSKIMTRNEERRKKNKDPLPLAATIPPLEYPYPALDQLGCSQKSHELWKSPLKIGKYFTKIYDIALILADGNLDRAVQLMPFVLQHVYGDHSKSNPICRNHVCLQKEYQQSMIITNAATRVVLDDVIRRYGSRKNLSCIIQRLDTNHIEHLNSITRDLLAKVWYSHDTTVYDCVCKCVVLFDNEGGWVFLRLLFESLGLEVTAELSNYLSQLEAVAGRNMTRKNSDSGKRARTENRVGRQEQTADRYQKDWKRDPSLRPGVGHAVVVPSTSDTDISDDEDDERLDPNVVEHTVSNGHAEQAVEEAKGEEEEDVTFVHYIHDLSYCSNKGGRELDIHKAGHSSSSSSSSSSSTRPQRSNTGGWHRLR